MEKLSRILKLQLFVILKGFFPTLKYRKVIGNSKVVLKKHFFAFKKIKLSLDNLLDEIFPSYLASLELDTKKLQNFQYEYKLLITRKEKISFLYNTYISLSHNIREDFSEYVIKTVNAPIHVSKHSRLTDIKQYLIARFKKNKIVDVKLEQLKLLPTTSSKSYQDKILDEKRKYLLKYRYGNITIDTIYTPVTSLTVTHKGNSTTIKESGVTI